MSDPRLIKVNDREIEVDPSLTLLQACEAAGEEIPRFCYHERLSVAGNCRMCLIEVKGGPPKPVASCAQNVRDLRPGPEGAPPELFTNTPMVKKAREGVMEFLLINHPLDCPICDQGGECDLQDQAVAYGRDGTRFEENKRAVEEKHMGPLIKTIMTRCIQCTRCVRFATEVAGVDDLGLVNRGENAEITTYLEKAVESELTGNLIDVCPVGALTSKPYAFTARPWELRKTETIDVMDAVGSNIRVDARGREVLRILPRLHEEVNEEWISDKSRFIWDGLKRQRLDQPFIRKAGKLVPASWDEALTLAGEKLKTTSKDKIAAIVGDLVAAEPIKALKDLMDGLGTPHLDCRQDGSKHTGPRSSYICNSTFEGLEDADAILLIGTNPRTEAAILNARLRKIWLNDLDVAFGLIGEKVDTKFEYDHLGTDASAISSLLEGAGDGFANRFLNANRPAILVGSQLFTRDDARSVLDLIEKLADKAGVITADWNGYNVIQTAAARVGALDLGFVPGEGGLDFNAILDGAQSGDIELVYNLGADECDTTKLQKAFVIYQGHHGDAGARTADIILPGAAYTEQPGLYVNMEGRAQMAMRATFPPGEAREDWSILRALSERAGKTLPYDDLMALRQQLIADTPSFGQLDTPNAQLEATPLEGAEEGADLDSTTGEQSVFGTIDGAQAPSKTAFSSAITNFWFTNPITRASSTMAECAAVMDGNQKIAAE